MDISECIEILQKITNARIVKADLARALAVDPAALRRKEIAKIQLKPSEIEKIESFYRVTLTNNFCFNGERQNDTTLPDKIKDFGKRVSELQAQHNFLDREMATLLKISEKDYLKLVTGKNLPNLDILMNIKRNFNVSIDYLLWG